MYTKSIIFFLAFYFSVLFNYAQNKKIVEVYPAVYETVTEQLLIGAEKKILECSEILAPMYDTIKQRLLIKEATMKWKKGKRDNNCMCANPEDCFLMCLVDVPEEYNTIQTLRLKKEYAQAFYDTVEEKVLIAEATKTWGERTRVLNWESTHTKEEMVRKWVDVPAEYTTIKYLRLKKEYEMAVYDTLTTTILLSEAKSYWGYKKDPNCHGANLEDCMVMFWEEIPAQYKTIKTPLIKGDFHCKEVILPAQYKTITKQIVKSPAVYKIEEGNGFSSNLVSLSPNPATSFIKVHFSQPNPSVKGKIEIWNMEGKLCQSLDIECIDKEISIENLSAGTYILQFWANGKQETTRFVKGE